MKALSFSRISLVIGLAVGIMVLWSAATPSAMGADSLIGGWYPMTGCPECYDTGSEPCPYGQYWPGGPSMYCSTGGNMQTCIAGTGSGNCGADDGFPCGGNEDCESIANGKCYF